ncbi:unnamed protein product [Mesocestoides corti]|uniref:DH domain-containing protein n=1 Tax=Mesocestoides corti TaxID=53468 RepID=A0A158QU52_MESCO|nr:unnamed protein product [Mesocestoides corti]
MAAPMEAPTTSRREGCSDIQKQDERDRLQEGIVSSCIISQSPPTEIVNTTTTTSTITDSNGRVKKLKTTTTTTLRTTTTVRRVCVVAPGELGGENALVPIGDPPSGMQPIEATSSDLGLPSAGSQEVVRLTHISGGKDSSTQGQNITQLTFMKPQTSTSEVVEVHTDADPAASEATDSANGKTTTKTVRKRVTTSVAAVFASRHTKVDGNSSPHPLKGARLDPMSSDIVEKLSQVHPEDGSVFFDGNTDFTNDDSAAMTALRECERQFATRLELTGNPDLSQSTITMDHYTNEKGKAVTTKTATLKANAFPSLFDGLPLYQGYGMISQHMKDNDQSESPVSIFFNGWLDQIDVASLTKMFEDASSTGLLSNELSNIFSDLSISPKSAIKGPGVEIEDVTSEDEKDSLVFDSKSGDVPTRKESTQSSHEDRGAATDDRIPTDEEKICYKNQILNQLSTKTGPCRIAWSEMPEAMFEVITSEASYYRSLQVLIEHFYGAPEFDCSRSATTIPEESTNETDGECTSCQSGDASSFSKSASQNNALSGGSRTGSITGLGEVGPAPVVKPVLSPTEKHHLFSNVLLICMASERFLQDLEARWSSEKPLLNEVCDLIVKHAGSVHFEPYLTYLRNQTYQVAAYRRLNRREDFQKAIARMHAHPAVGKNHLDSFLALPMQRLTRLKLLVEVIQKLQAVVASDAEERAITGSTETMTPAATEGIRRMKITPQQQENASIALRELKRLLSESESEKKLMDEKARLLALSSALEFPENVKRIAISDKRLIKEGELRSATSDGKATVLLKKLGRKKPETFYLILFNDLLMVTKLKKNDRYLVQDYCPRDKVYVTIGNPSDASTHITTGSASRSQTLGSNNYGGLRRQKRPSAGLLGLKGIPRHHTTTLEVPEGLFKTASDNPHANLPSGGSLSSASSNSSTIEVCGTASSTSPPLSPTRPPSVRLRRSGSSLSSKSVPSGSSYSFSSAGACTIHRDLPLLLYVCLTESQSGTCTEFCFTTNDSAEYEAWYRALHSKSLKLNSINTGSDEQQVISE